MSSTGIATGRMARAPVRVFGTRRVPPAPPRAPRPSRPSVSPAQPWAVSRLLSAAWLATASLLLEAWLAASHLFLAGWLAARPLFTALPGLLLQGLHSLTRPLARRTVAALSPSQAGPREAAIQALLLRSDASATFVRLLAYLGALAGLALTAGHLVGPTAADKEINAEAQTKWIHVAKPFPTLSLPMPELTESGTDYAMHRHVAGGGRKDILTWGELEGSAPHMMVEVYRAGREVRRFDAAEIEIAARLEGVGAGKLKPAGTMETKFGPVALVELSLAKPARQCLGFARAYDRPRLQILGWHCTGGAAPVERDLAACALDRLTLLAAGSAPKVRELFARAELKRNFCGQRSHLLTPTPKLGPSAPPPERAWSGEVGTGSPKKTMRH